MREILFRGRAPSRLALCIVGGWLWLGVAQGAPPPSAESLFSQGLAHQRAGELDAATRAFESAFARSPQPSYLYQLGQVHREAGRRKEAIAALRGYLKLLPDAPDRAAVGEQISELEQPELPAAPVVFPTQRPPAEPLPPPPGAAVGGAPGAIGAVGTAGATGALTRRGAPGLTTNAAPLYKSPWLWTAIGGVLVAGGIGVGLALGLQPREPSFLGAPGALQ